MKYNVGDIVKIKDGLRHGQSIYAPYSNYCNIVCGNELAVSGKIVVITGRYTHNEVYVTCGDVRNLIIWESAIERKVQ